MSIVSGLATAPGISALLNAPRDNNLLLRFATGDPAPQATVKRAEGDGDVAGRAQSVRPVVAQSKAESLQTPVRRESNDPRYTKFLDAVEALRVDLSEANLTRERVSELRAAAKEVFQMENVPEDTRPEPGEVQRAEAIDRAARLREAEAKEAEADRLEAEARRAEGAAAEQKDRAPRETPEPVSQPARGSVTAETRPQVDLPEADLPKVDLPEMPAPAPAPEARTVPQAPAGPVPEAPAAAKVAAADPVPAAAQPAPAPVPEPVD